MVGARAEPPLVLTSTSRKPMPKGFRLSVRLTKRKSAASARTNTDI
jgi:hypothetical protein